MASRQFKQFLCGYTTIVFLMGLLFLYGSSLVSADTLPDGKIVSLSQSPDSNYLFAIRSEKVYRLNTDTGQRTSIPVPAPVESITSVVVRSKDANVIYLAAPGNGILRSLDGGKTWEQP